MLTVRGISGSDQAAGGGTHHDLQDGIGPINDVGMLDPAVVGSIPAASITHAGQFSMEES